MPCLESVSIEITKNAKELLNVLSSLPLHRLHLAKVDSNIVGHQYSSSLQELSIIVPEEVTENIIINVMEIVILTDVLFFRSGNVVQSWRC